MKKRTVAILVIILSMLMGWLLTTLYIVNYSTTEPILFGLYFEQIIGGLVGFLVGIMWATFIVRATFLEKLRTETFSFIGLALAIFTFTLNVVIPRFIPMQMLSYATPAGEVVTPTDATALTFSATLGVVLVMFITALVFSVIHSKK